MFARQTYPHRVCSLPDAVTMLSRMLPASTGRAVEPGVLRAAIDELRERVLP